MCFVTAAAITSAVAGAAGAGVSAAGMLAQGGAASANAAYQAKVAANNQIIAQQNAAYALQAGEATAEAQSLKGAAQGGAVKAAEAANNVDVNSGSALDVQESQRETSELDILTTLNNAELQAYGYQSQATGFGAESGLQTAVSEQAPIGAVLGAGGSLLSNAGSVGFKWLGSVTPTPTDNSGYYQNTGPTMV